ncbi:MAG: hypothetical protein WCL44_02910 [bacterium]
MSEPEEIQVPVQFIRDDEFEAKDWPEYDVPISPECSEEDFQKEFCDVINELENVLLIEGWKRGLMRPHDDYEIAMESWRPHRSLDFSIISDRILTPHFLPLLAGFLRTLHNRWMLHISDERWTPESGCAIDFKIVVEPDMIWVTCENPDILPKLGI